MIKNLSMRIILLFLAIIISLNNDVYAKYNINTDFFHNFKDCYLDKYIFEALENNHKLKIADYKVQQYRYEIKTQFSNELPSLSVSSNYLGVHFPKGDGNFLLKQNSYVLPFQVGYEPDLLLKNRDKTKSKTKLYKAEVAKQKSTYLSLLSDVANAYINILLYDYLIEIQEKILKDEIKNVSYSKAKYNSGIIDLIELNDALSSQKTQEILYQNLIKNRNTALYNFSVLIGKSPNCINEIKRSKFSDFEYKSTIPNEINSDLIYNRPDIIEIENKLKSAKIDILVAKKDFFPSFNITGFLVFDTAGSGNFFSWNSSFAWLIAGLTQDIFKGGYKIANLKIKKAKYNELFEEYKEKDLNAINEINNALNLINQDKESEKKSKIQLELEQKNFRKTGRKLDRGIISNVDYLHDRNALHQREQLYATAKATRLNDYITLYKAVGGEL